MKHREPLALLLLLLLSLTACAGKAPAESASTASDHNQALRSVAVQGRRLQAVFGDFSPVTDCAFQWLDWQGRLEYVAGQVLWETNLEGVHRVLRDSGYATWHEQVAAENAEQRAASDALPAGFPQLSGDNVRYQPAGGLAAYRRSGTAGYDLLLRNPIGQERTILTEAEELVLLGWAGATRLVAIGQWAQAEQNVFLIDVWDDAVELADAQVDSLSPGQFVASTVKLGAGLGPIWDYDGQRVAYQLGAEVYARDLQSGEQQVLAVIGDCNVSWADHDLFVTVDGEGRNPTLWLQGQGHRLSGNSGFVADREGQRLYYLSESLVAGNRIHQLNLANWEERQLLAAAADRTITGFDLSPDRRRLLLAETNVPNYNPGEQVDELLSVLDLLTGERRSLAGLDKDGWVRHQQVVWLQEDLIALGHCRLMAPSDGQTLWFYRLTGSSLQLVRQTELNSGLFAPDRRLIILSDFDHSDGYDASFRSNLWRYDAVSDSLRQLTRKADWQVQQDHALAYQTSREWLFASRFRGYLRPGDSLGQLLHGVLIDNQGREFTLCKLRDEQIQQALWFGDRLVVRTSDSLLVYDFSR